MFEVRTMGLVTIDGRQHAATGHVDVYDAC
jgi:hypothetical protein